MKHLFTRRRPVLCRLLCLACLLCGGPVCAADAQAGTYTDDEGRTMLRTELGEFERYIDSTMKAAHEILRSRSVTGGDLKKLDEWQATQRTQYSQALRQQDPLAALTDAWAVSKSLTGYLTLAATPDQLPETCREVALDMLKRREDRLLHIASRYLPEESIAALSSGIDAFTEGQSASHSGGQWLDPRQWTAPLFSVWAKSQATAGSVLQVPLMPGRALKGVSESGKALAGIRESTADAVQVASQLPESIRTEFQIALADLMGQRAEIMEILGTVDSVSTNLRAATESSRLTAAEIRGLVDLSRATEKPEGAEPFDIRVYGAAAESIERGAAEIRALILDLRGIAGDEAFSGRLGLLGAEADASAQQAAVRAREVIDHLALRLIQVAAAGFILACVHTIFRVRLARGTGAPRAESATKSTESIP
jgi:hypothetical protein